MPSAVHEAVQTQVWPAVAVAAAVAVVAAAAVAVVAAASCWSQVAVNQALRKVFAEQHEDAVGRAG